jgi:hypothetical protein
MMETIPRKDSDFNIAQEIISNAADTNRTLWNLDSEWMDNELLPKKGEWTAAWEEYLNPATRTPLITFTKTVKRKNYERLMRILVKGLQSNPKVTPDDLRNMGIAVPSSSRKPVPAPGSYPDGFTDTSVMRRITVHFRDHGSDSAAKPYGVHGAEIRWDVRDTPPTEVSDLTKSSFDTHTPHTLEFEESQRGKTVWFCLRWENSKGEKGPWGELINAIIP